jgi:hypothetical protein
MKKLKFMKMAMLFFIAITFTNCEENGDILFEVVDEVPSEITVQGFLGLSAFSSSSTADLEDLLSRADTFIEADVEKVTVALKDYSGTSLTGTIKIKVGTIEMINETTTLSAAPTTFIIPASASDILAIVNSGTMTITLEGATTAPIADNDFKIVVTPTVRGTI